MPIYNAPIYDFVSGNVKGSDVAYANLISGTDNVALGQGTLGLLTDGTDNIALGINALAAVTTGSRNIAICSGALQSLTFGDYNVVLGFNGASVCTTGLENIGIGKAVISSLTSGSNNIAFGTNALNSTLDGTNNVGIGTGAGFPIVHGTNNTFLGAGASTSALSDRSFATAIGSNALATADNQIRLGRSAGQDTIKFTGRLEVGTPAGADQSGSFFMGAGAPNNANGTDGDIYCNTTGGALTTIYQKRAGAWVGIV